MHSLQEQLLSAIHSIWRRRWIALGCAWAICLLGWLALALVPNSYQSRARIFIQLDDALAEQVGIGVADKKRDIERIRQTLTSAVNLEKVVRSTRLGDTIEEPKQMENAILKLADNIKVVNQGDNLFEITATANNGSFSNAENSALAQSIAHKLIDIFREENLSGDRGEMAETLEFVNQQLKQRERELEAAEAKRTSFEAQYPELALGGAAMNQRLETSRTNLRDIEADLAASQSALAAIDGQLASTPRMIAGGGGGGDSTSQASLIRAQSDLAAMRARGLTENHPDIKIAKNQIEALKKLNSADRGGATSSFNPAYSSLQSIRAERQANVQSLQARKAALQADVAAFTASAIQDPALATEAQRINRDYDVLRQQYDKLLQDREELRLRGSVKTEREAVKFRVMDPPTTPRSPVAPNRPLLLFGILLFGLVGGGASAFALSKFQSVFSTASGLERTMRMPVLGGISQVRTPASKAVDRRNTQYFYAGLGALVALFLILFLAEIIQRGLVG